MIALSVQTKTPEAKAPGALVTKLQDAAKAERRRPPTDRLVRSLMTWPTRYFLVAAIPLNHGAACVAPLFRLVAVKPRAVCSPDLS